MRFSKRLFQVCSILGVTMGVAGVVAHDPRVWMHYAVRLTVSVVMLWYFLRRRPLRPERTLGILALVALLVNVGVVREMQRVIQAPVFLVPGFLPLLYNMLLAAYLFQPGLRDPEEFGVPAEVRGTGEGTA